MKKVLIITYYWPPAGGPGVQRVLKFAKYLPQFGWEPVILTVKNGEYPAIDESLLNDIPKDIKVYKTKTLEPFAIYKTLTNSKGKKIETYTLTEKKSSLTSRLFKWIRLNLFVPDARIGWKYYAYKTGKNIIMDENIDLIFSSSPPHSLQLAAKKIAETTKKPWISDFRDLWLDAFYIPTHEQGRFAKKKNAQLEKMILRSATQITTTSKEIRHDFISKSGKNNVNIIYNGFDKNDFSLTTKKSNDKAFIIRYFGFLSSGQDPLNLYKALNDIKETHPNIYTKITIEIYGKIDNEVNRSIASYNLQDKIKHMGYVAHNEVPQLMHTSNCLLLLLPKEKYKGMVPGKVFEYFAAKKYILGIGNTKSEVTDLLKSTASGKMYNHNEDISDVLIDLVLHSEKHSKSIKQNSIDFFSRNEQTRLLAELFTKTIEE